MATVTFQSPFYSYNTNPSKEEVEAMFLNRPLEDWEGDDSGSIMSFEDDERSSTLSIFAHRDYGFMILFDETGEETAVLTEGQHTGAIVAFSDGYTSCFQEQLVSKETAWEAVEYFMQTGKRLESLNWKEYEVPDVAPEAYTA